VIILSRMKIIQHGAHYSGQSPSRMVTVPKQVVRMFSKILVQNLPQVRQDVGGEYGKD
jgi:hypothetical protein